MFLCRLSFCACHISGDSKLVVGMYYLLPTYPVMLFVRTRPWTLALPRVLVTHWVTQRFLLELESILLLSGYMTP